MRSKREKMLRGRQIVGISYGASYQILILEMKDGEDEGYAELVDSATSLYRCLFSTYLSLSTINEVVSKVKITFFLMNLEDENNK